MQYFKAHRQAGQPASRIWIGLVAASVVLAGVSGCAGAPSALPVTVVLAASATANEPEPVLAAPDVTLLSRAAAGSTDAVAFVVSTATGEPTRVPLTPRRADGQVEYGPRRQQLIRQSVSMVQRVLGTQAATGPFDLLSTLAAAVRVARPPGTLIVLSSGLSTAGPFQLQEAGWDANPAGIAAQLKRQGELPDLDGWTVIFSGLGVTSGRAAAAAPAAAGDADRLLDGHLPGGLRGRVPHRQPDPPGSAVAQHRAGADRGDASRTASPRSGRRPGPGRS